MKSTALKTIEQQLPLLSSEEQLSLIAHLAQHLRKSRPPSNFHLALAEMAHDPQVQAELRQIEAEFSTAEQDGLEKT